MAYPILYASIVPGVVPSDYGLGVLAPISCTVEETRNGIYELEMLYPANGIHASEIATRRILKIKPNYIDEPQLFRIYKVGKTLAGQFSVKAAHISYDLDGLSIISGEAAHIIPACQLLQNSAPGYTFSTDKSNAGNFKITEPSSVRSWLAGKEGSLLDIYGTGEYHFDNFNVQLKLHRGVTTPRTTIRYGKNLLQLSQELSSDNLRTSVQAYYKGNDGIVVVGSEISTGLLLDSPVKKMLDCSGDFQETPSVADLDAMSISYISGHELTVPTNNIKLDFAQIGQLKDRVDLCDMVNIYYEAYGITVSAKCIRTKWDCLEERYIETEFGDAKYGLTEIFANDRTEIKKDITQSFKVAKAYTDAVKASLDDDIDNLQDQIDGNITTWYYDYVPTTENEPAVNWTTEEERENHAGDLFFDNTTQFAYRWTYIDNAWSWVLIQDSTIAQALGLAQQAYDEAEAASDLADHKRRVFITTPEPPYDVGDLWSDSNDIYYCSVSKTTGQEFSPEDWELATNYMNRSAMEEAINQATDIITGNAGGYVVWHDSNGDGKPDEVLAMDTMDINTAVEVLRLNKNGIGLSVSGYAGPYTTAATARGFVADAITTGNLDAARVTIQHLTASMIKGGKLTLGGLDNQAGTFELLNEQGIVIGEMDKTGLKFYGEGTSGQRPYVLLNNSVGFAGFDANDTKLFWVSRDEFHMKKCVAESEISACNKIRFIPMTITQNGEIINDGVAIVALI